MVNIITIASSSDGCCYIAEFGEKQIILEVGAPVNKIMEFTGPDFSRVVACLVSHVHQDHCRYLPDLASRSTVPIWSTREVSDRYYNSVVNILEPNELIRLTPSGEFFLEVHSMRHDVECFGFEIRHYSKDVDPLFRKQDSVLFYATDTGDIDFDVEGLTHLMIETNYSFELLNESCRDKSSLGRVFEGHLDIDHAIEFAVRHQKTLEQIHLLHMSDAHADEDQFKLMMSQATGIPVYIAKKR